MKCPKCGYLGFEQVESCRNCGYEFSLSRSVPEPDAELPLRIDSRSEVAIDDLPLPISGSQTDLDRLIGLPEAASEAPAPIAVADAEDIELPLFTSATPDDEPMIKTPSSPRAPLAVRRVMPDATRPAREHPRMQSLAFDPDDAFEGRPDDSRSDRRLQPGSAEVLQRESEPFDGTARIETAGGRPAGLFARLAAVVIDLVLLAAIDIVAIYFTIEICGLTLLDVGVLPKGPLLAFLLIQNGGYLVAFTAGGQTIGKMSTGIRVVSASPDTSLDLGHALLREMLWLVLAIPAGLGFLSALSNPDRRGFHDRFAGTRVVVS